uniref:Uncharacterized protein n=1 Tax=Anguilla anguilla TaxID=7936 RepID=A0A0E9QK84_ANGAN
MYLIIYLWKVLIFLAYIFINFSLSFNSDSVVSCTTDHIHQPD